MPLRIVYCEDPTVISFCRNVLKEDLILKHTSIEEVGHKPNSVVLGKIVKVLSFSAEQERYILLVKEILPSYEYGGKFKAVVGRGIARELNRFSPETGDRVAFHEPFINLNPAYEPEESIENKKHPKYILYSKYKHDSAALMWFTKKEKMGGKSDDDKRVKQTSNHEKNVQHNAPSTKLREYKLPPGGSISGQYIPPSNKTSKKQNTNISQTSDIVRQKPVIQLPQKPQIPVNTKRLNPHYTYTTISSIKSSDLPKQSVNLFAVVSEIIKPITTTKKNKYTLMCLLVDDSDEEYAQIKFHFFTSEDTIIKQIEPGNILRLHRAKLESYNNDIDGRVFFSHDIVIFNKDCPDTKPITSSKNTLITDDDWNRVETLKKWYIGYLRKPTLLSDIRESGKYCILCKVVMGEPKKEDNTVTITVTDGSALQNLIPTKPLKRYNQRKDGKKDHIVTEIIAHNKLNEYARLKVDDFVLISDVEAVKLANDKFRLETSSETSPEILAEKTLHVADIECRIEQFLKSFHNKKNETKEIDDLNNSEQEDSLILVENSHNIVHSLSSQENETSVQTRQQRTKQKISPANILEKPVPDFCDNKSCQKPNTGMLDTKDDCDAKNTESDPGTKSRKQLFTPNYKTDLSNASTDETSEHNLETSRHLNSVQDEDVVNPAHTNFNDIMEKVKTKYCTPRRPGQPSQPQNEEGVDQRSSSRKTRAGNKVPLVMLEKLSDSEGNITSRLNAIKKRGLNPPEPQEEDFEDDKTVLNMSFHATNLNRPRQGNKRIRLESLSTEEGNPRTSDADVNHELENRGAKVSNWLFHPNNRIATTYQDEILTSEYDTDVFKQLLCQDTQSPDMSKYISSDFMRIKAFLLDVVPDPSTNPLDLVSGYCHLGCQRIFKYSTLRWLEEEHSAIPLCPECILLEQEKELQLMLLMKLVIMDPCGRHTMVLVARNQAEQFLNCTVRDYVKDDVVRKSRVQLLTDYTMQSTYRNQTTPLLDIGIYSLNSSSKVIYLLVNSTLKLPRL